MRQVQMSLLVHRGYETACQRGPQLVWCDILSTTFYDFNAMPSLPE